MFFTRKRSQDIEAFAVTLARDFAARCPAEKAQQDPAKTAKAVDDACNRAAAYQQEKSLGVYGKAKLGTAFKLELKGSGYSQEFVDAFTGQLLLTMSGRRK